MTAKPCVLVIDDDEWMVDEYIRTLSAAGYQTERAHNSLEGIDMIDRVRPSAIILDLFMPGPSGLVLLHELQSHADLARIPVILVTNAANDIKPGALQPYGVALTLDKTTMQPSDIVAAVKKVLP